MLVWTPNTELTINPFITFRARTQKLTERPACYVFVLLTSCKNLLKCSLHSILITHTVLKSGHEVIRFSTVVYRHWC